MLKWFKRFLPEDDEQDKISMQKKYIEFQSNINGLLGQQGDSQMDQNNLYAHSKLISQLKQELFENLLESLKLYQEVKENKSIEEALELYGQSIMEITEKYHKYVASDIQNQYDIEFEKQKEAIKIENGNNLGNIDEINMKIVNGYAEKLESQMQYILQIVPQEIIDNYSISSPVMKGNKNQFEDNSDSYDQENSDKNNSLQKKSLKFQKLKINDSQEVKNYHKLNKREEKQKGKRIIQLQGTEISDLNFIKSKQLLKSKSENSFTAKRTGKKRIAIKGFSKHAEQSKQSEESAKDYEEEDQDIEEEYQDIQEDAKRLNDIQATSEAQVNHMDYLSDEQMDQFNENKAQVNTHEKPDGLFQIQKMKPIISEMANKYQNAITNLNKQELKIFDSLQKQIKYEDDWQSFIKLFLLYFEGVISQKDFFIIFDDKFSSRLKSELKKEVQTLLPSRETQRRLQSDILKPWNDLENQKFEKIHDSSYYKIDNDFPLPICSGKVNPQNCNHYLLFLNDKYLSLSTGSENFKFKIRNINEDLIFKNEDDMYKLDRQIEMFKKCQEIVQKELINYYKLTQKEKQKYEFPKYKFRVLIHYWEKKYKDALIPLLTNKTMKEEHLIQFCEGLTKKLNELQNQKYDQMPQFEEVFRKNFVKSLDHRSILYNKEFIKKFQQKQQHMLEIKQAAMATNDGSLRQINTLKGGNCQDSPFYHSFGNFLKNKNSIFDIDKEINDYPIDMKFLDQVKDLQPSIIEKLPHSRLVFKDIDSLQIAIKIMLLHINYSQSHHANDRPRLISTMKQVLVKFMKFQDFDILQHQCQNQSSQQQKIEYIKPKQIELIMNQDCHYWYITRCQQIQKNEKVENQNLNIASNQNQSHAKDFQRSLRARGNGEQNEKEYQQSQDIQPIKIQIQQNSKALKSQFEEQKKSENQIEEESIKSKNESSASESDEEKTSTHNKASCSQQQKQIYKQLDIKFDQQKNPQQEITDSLYLPFFDSQQNGHKHSLFYAPSNVFMFLRFFYALYERVYFSKLLIVEKINQDLSEMSPQDKIKHGIARQLSGNISDEIFESVFVKERYEHLLKAIFATTTQQSFGGSQVQGIAGQLQINGHGYSHNQQIMDHNKFEDFARQLLGKNAFLLFQIDKIISQAVKQVAQMYSDTPFKKAVKLYDTYNSNQLGEHQNLKINEQSYLANYTQQIVDQFTLSEYQNNSQGQSGKQFVKKQTECKQSSYMIEKYNPNMRQLCSYKNDIINSSIVQGSNSNALNLATTAIQQQNFQFFRFLWSKESNILSIHYINMNPNISQLSQGKSYKKLMQDNYNIISRTTVQPIDTLQNQNQDQNEAECIQSKNQESNKFQNNNSNVYLLRNLRKMHDHRNKEGIQERSIIKNGMTLRYFSIQNQMTFDAQGEDVFQWKEGQENQKECKLRKTKLKVKDFIKQDFNRQCQASIIRAKRLKTLINQ